MIDYKVREVKPGEAITTQTYGKEYLELLEKTILGDVLKVLPQGAFRVCVKLSVEIGVGVPFNPPTINEFSQPLFEGELDNGGKD